jgi:hypothetical protein
MRQAGANYLQEEARLRGARPRVKAVLYPFELDYGLAADSGEFVHTTYGNEAGKLVLAEGYSSGSWTSPIMHTSLPFLNTVVPQWQYQAGEDSENQVYLRTAESVAEISSNSFSLLTRGEEFSLSPWFQVKVELGQTPGYVAGLRFEGRLTLGETEILDPGSVRVDLARDFSELRAGDHSLVLDNRQGQWQSQGENFYLQGLDWIQKKVALYHGWRLADGQDEWQLVYQGIVERLTGMAHGWQEQHRASLESQDRVAARLKRLVGVPSADGDRQPFMRGSYLAKGELVDTTAAEISSPVKAGSGSGTLKVLGTYRGDSSQDYLLDIETGGEVGEARFRWSTNQGQSWQETDLLTGGPESPVDLEEGLAVYWESGSGLDLGFGDRWTFSASTTVYHYQIHGAPFESISEVYLNDAETSDGVTADAATGLILVSGGSAQVKARVVKDLTTHPVDIISDLLTEVELSQAIHQDSFALAKSLTPEYAIGVRFENLSAAQALREILSRCLYDLWLDFGEIKISPFLGED